MKRTTKYRLFLLLLILAAIAFICRSYSKKMDSTSSSENTSIVLRLTSGSNHSNTSHLRLTETSSWNLILVNKWNKISSDFSVELVQLNNGHAIDKRAYPDLQAMMDDARTEGLSPIICSSYRSYEKQEQLYKSKINDYISQGYSEEAAKEETGKWVAVPGTSEHETGLAVDIVSADYQILDEQQENTPEQQWLMKYSYRYGFILRYPNEKSDITGIYYEPWHYRYVGKEAAKEIYEKGICLEEYLDAI